MKAQEILDERARMASELLTRGVEQGEALGELLDLDLDEVNRVLTAAHQQVHGRLTMSAAAGNVEAFTSTYVIASAVLVGIEIGAAKARLDDGNE